MTKKYDNNGNIIYQKYSDGLEKWYEYDDQGKIIHSRDSNGIELCYYYKYSLTGKKYRYKVVSVIGCSAKGVVS